MKFSIFAFFLCIAVVLADPIKFNDNNVNDIINVKADASLVLSSLINEDIVSLIGLLKNQQGLVAVADGAGAVPYQSPATSPEMPKINIPPALMGKLSQLLLPKNE
ncbi:CLUMA_CG017679, isoform A [Clunio marinus]|uniref:CLUMA_CG017679, isoform A n=1 Tax=Clunio marinus TaxID=568069 RepID=A0A1J1IWE2_9DIPT|nr:CLUMA_CG017679, isoform A [Clunio marinus]